MARLVTAPQARELPSRAVADELAFLIWFAFQLRRGQETECVFFLCSPGAMVVWRELARTGGVGDLLHMRGQLLHCAQVFSPWCLGLSLVQEK